MRGGRARERERRESGARRNARARALIPTSIFSTRSPLPSLLSPLSPLPSPPLPSSKYDACEGWVFCTKPEGCGWGCVQYTDKHGRLAPSFPYALGDDTPLPIAGQGPFGLGCLSDRWPAGMCTLKTKVDPADVASLRAGTAPADNYWGWVAGLRKPGGGGLVATGAAAAVKAPPAAAKKPAE